MALPSFLANHGDWSAARSPPSLSVSIYCTRVYFCQVLVWTSIYKC